MAQVFSCEFCKISKNAFCYKIPPACNFIKKEPLAQMFSCEFCRISKNTFCYRTPLVAASVCCTRKVAAVKIEKSKLLLLNIMTLVKLIL